MNAYTLTLSSLSTSYIQGFPEIPLSDHTELTISLEHINENTLPLYVKIDWGDGEVNIYDNNIYKEGRPINNVIKYSPVLTDTYKKQYYPSEYALYKTLTLQVLIAYADGGYNWFIIPIKIRTYDFFDSITDIQLKNVNILPTDDNSKEYQFATSEGGFLVEIRGG